MRTKEEVEKRIKDYTGVECIYTDCGYIAWQCSTGENIEILLIEVKEPRKGYGRKLVSMMCRVINPFNSVFVVRRAENEIAGNFYRSLGFVETTIKGLYKDEDAVIGVVNFKQLCQNLSINLDFGKSE